MSSVAAFCSQWRNSDRADDEITASAVHADQQTQPAECCCNISSAGRRRIGDGSPADALSTTLRDQAILYAGRPLSCVCILHHGAQRTSLAACLSTRCAGCAHAIAICSNRRVIFRSAKMQAFASFWLRTSTDASSWRARHVLVVAYRGCG